MTQLHSVAQYTCQGSDDTCEVIVELPEVVGETRADQGARFMNAAQGSSYTAQCSTTCKVPDFSRFVGYGNNIVREDRSTPPFDCDKKTLEFDDGDTFECNDKIIRILGIDAAEIFHPGVGICEDQDPAGRVVAQILHSALTAAAKITVVPTAKPDKYGRTLAYVLLDGELYGPDLVKQGLVYQTVKRYGTNGLPEYARQILDASRSAQKPKFQDPSDWRKAHQHSDVPCPTPTK